MRHLVGYTDTPAGHGALALAERFARSSGATLDVVLVVPDLPAGLVPPDATYDRYVDATARRWLDHAEKVLDPAIPRNLRLTRSDSAPTALLDSVEADTTLLVVGAKRNALGMLTLGNITSALLHSAPLPVAVSPEGTQVTLRSTPISRVTCFLGTRPGGPHLMDTAIARARSLGVPLRIVSLVTLDRMTTAEAPEEIVSRAADRARELLPDTIVTTETGAGSGIEAAVRATDWDPAEIAFIGSSRLAQPKRLFVGSTATKVLRVLPVPLIVVPSTADPERTPTPDSTDDDVPANGDPT